MNKSDYIEKGFNSGGIHKTKVNGVKDCVYELWLSMMKRCYSPKVHSRQPTYTNCNVCEEWHDFQNFAEWVKGNDYYRKGYQLDKDLILLGNKTYSPNLCAFVPREINNILLDSRTIRGDLPMGVSTSTKGYKAALRINGSLEYLGSYETPMRAYSAYKSRKEMYVKEKANKWRGRIDERVYDALMSWTVNP